MKNSLLVSFLFSSLCLFSAIDTTSFNSKIKNVTVFFNGAEVNRTAKLKLTKGKHILLFSQLPEMINPQSIQVEGIENATILSVKHEVAYDRSALESPEIKTAEKEIEAIKINVQRLNNQINVLQVEEDILLNNSKFTSEDNGANTEELRKAAEFYRSRLNTIRNKVIDLSIEVRENKDKMAQQFELMNKILAKNKKRFSKIFVAIECKTNVDEELDISYYIAAAGWVPTYDFRVKDINEPLKIVYNANVYQSSGEDWEKVSITLSSNDPSLSGNKPELQQWILGEKPTYISQNQDNQVATQVPAYGGVSAIRGEITSSDNGEPVPFANVTLFKGDEQILGTTTDFNGLYTLKPIESGYYDLQVSYVGFQTKRVSGLQIKNDRITIQNVPISEGVALQEVEIIEYSKPLIELDDMSTGYSERRNDNNPMVVRSVDNISKVSGNGVISRDNGSNSLNVRGGRSGETVTYIDGVKVYGSRNLPKSSIEEVTINNSYPDYINNSYPYDQTQYDGYKKKSSKNFISNSFNKNTLDLSYEIKIPYSIPTDGKDYTIKIKETDVPVEYEYFIVPKIDKDAFLVANLDNWEELNLLSGKSSLYFQGKFTGESYINVDQAEDTLAISLGRDKGIFVSREQTKELDDKRFYTNDIKETVGWDIVVKNNKNVAITINLQDQYPVSNRKSMEVELLESMEATIDEKLGMLEWNFTLAPLEKKELTFKYEVKYPKYLNIRVR